MTKVKKFLGMVMAALMCFALTPVAAFAADGDQVLKGTITIKNTTEGETYTAYKMLDLTYNGDKAYAYTVAPGWENFFTTVPGSEYVEIDNGYVSWNPEKMEEAKDDDGNAYQVIKDPKVLTDAAIKYVMNPFNGIKATASGEAQKDQALEFTGLPLGYYLVTSTVGTICSINTTDYNAVINDKNENPTIDKQVKEDSTGEFGETNDASIGETVEFKSTINATAGASNYTYHDKMSEGLTFTGEVTVTLNGEKVSADNYTLETEKLTDQDCTFEVSFLQEFCATLSAGDKLVISYSAVVNENAIIAGNGNTNEAKLTFGNNSNTEWDKTTTFVWQLDFLKFANSDGKEIPLANAEFALSLNADDTDLLYNALTFIQDSVDAEGVPTYKVAPADYAEENENALVSTIVTNDTGKFNIIGLDADTYYLHEIAAPDGYNKLASSLPIVINKVVDEETNKITGYTITYNNEEIGQGTIKVENKTGLELPSTGGIGTMVLYVVGALLVLGAIVVLVRRRSSAK